MKSFIFLVTCFCFLNETFASVSFSQMPIKHMHPPPLNEPPSHRQKRYDDGLFHRSVYESTTYFWKSEAQKKLRSQLEKKMTVNVAKNLILFVGDGMSITTVTAARIYLGQKMGFAGEENVLSFEEFPHIGLSKTYCVDKQTADSACSATAYLTGVKANYATLGVNSKVKHNDCIASLDEENHVSSIMDWAQKAGKATGIVTTTRVTHASPSGTFAHSANRDWESDTNMLKFSNTSECSDIAKQLVRNDPGRKFNVIYGGGRKKFVSERLIDEDGKRGERSDGLDLIDEWLTTKDSPAHFIHDRRGLHKMNHSNVEYVLGLFESDHLKYQLNAGPDQPTLKEMTISAIEVMKKNPNGFVLFVEGGRIDHAHHQNMAKHALEETVQFADAIQAAMDITDEKNTLMVVTADHAHTMTLSGYSQRGRNIVGLNSEKSDVDGMPYSTLSYANGPSGKPRRNISEIEMESSDYRYPSYVPLVDETHGGDDVTIYARGPYSHLFSGVLEQNMIPHFMAFASCIGDGLTACNKRSIAC